MMTMNNDPERMVKIKAKSIEEAFQLVIRKMPWIDANPIVTLLKQFEELEEQTLPPQIAQGVAPISS